MIQTKTDQHLYTWSTKHQLSNQLSCHGDVRTDGLVNRRITATVESNLLALPLSNQHQYRHLYSIDDESLRHHPGHNHLRGSLSECLNQSIHPANATFSTDRCDITPFELPDDVDNRLGLLRIRGDHPSEVFEFLLVAQLFRCCRITYLRHFK